MDKFTVISLVVVALIALSVYLFMANATLKDSLQFEKKLSAQNTAALEDSVHKKAEALNTMSVFVRDLNTGLAKKDSEYTILQSKYIVAIRNSHNTGKSVATTGVDSVGKFIQAAFNGKRGIATFSGWTKVYPFDSLATPAYSLDLAYDTINIKQSLFRGLDGIWRMRSESITPDVTLLAISPVVDQSIFKSVESKLPVEDKTPHSFGIGGVLDRTQVSPGVVFAFNRSLVLLNYRLYDRNDNAETDWKNKIQLGYYYFTH